MDIQWVELIPDANHGNRKGSGAVQAFVRELAQRPGQWALFKILPQGKSWTGQAQYRLHHPGTEWKSRKINGVSHIYGRWIGDEK